MSMPYLMQVSRALQQVRQAVWDEDEQRVVSAIVVQCYRGHEGGAGQSIVEGDGAFAGHMRRVLHDDLIESGATYVVARPLHRHNDATGVKRIRLLAAHYARRIALAVPGRYRVCSAQCGWKQMEHKRGAHSKATGCRAKRSRRKAGGQRRSLPRRDSVTQGMGARANAPYLHVSAEVCGVYQVGFRRIALRPCARHGAAMLEVDDIGGLVA